MSQPRTVSQTYTDPLDLIWLETARRLGMNVVRTTQAYASWDGRGTLAIALPAELDDDDCLAQLVLHEICHALVAGPGAFHLVDWGLDNASEQHLAEEHATNRLQAALTQPYGLRRMFATTTEFRRYYDQLPADPLAGESDPSVRRAYQAHERARTGPWARRLEAALLATHRLAREMHGIAPADSLWAAFEPPHSTGLPAALGSDKACGGCAWFSRDGGERGACKKARFAAVDGSATVAPTQGACARWEPPLSSADCGACGACCRGGFDWVEVGPGEPVKRRYPELITCEGDVCYIARPGGRCRALTGDGTLGEYRCGIYSERPQSCAEFELAGEACLQARRRVGLSR